MAIQMRRGQLAQYDKSKMLPGEWGISIDNDSDNQKAFISFAPGVSKEVMMVEDAEEQIAVATAEAIDMATEEAEAWAHGNNFHVNDYASGDGSTRAFTLAETPSSILGVYVNGSSVSAYTLSGKTITFTTAPASGSNNIRVYYTVNTTTDNAKYYLEQAEAVAESIPEDYSELSDDVDQLKNALSFVESDFEFEPKKNLIDFSKVIEGKELANQLGGLMDSPTKYATDWIEVKPNTKYTVSGISSYYRAEVGANKSSYTGLGQNVATFTTGANTKYVRFNSLISGYATPQLELGDTATAYEPYALVSKWKKDVDDELNTLSQEISSIENLSFDYDVRFSQYGGEKRIWFSTTDYDNQFQEGDIVESLNDDYQVCWGTYTSTTRIPQTAWGTKAVATGAIHSYAALRKNDLSDISGLTAEYVKSIIKITKTNALIQALGNKKSPTRFAHISIDDCTFWADLIANENVYASAFENAKLAHLKQLHESYGAVFTLNCFTESDDYSIADVPSKFAGEFRANKDWLRFSFHGTDVDTLFSTDMVDEIKGYYNTFASAIYTMTGDYECIDRVARLSSFTGTLNNVKALRDCNAGIKGLLTKDTPVDGSSYYLTEAQYTYINMHCKLYDADNYITFIRSMLRLPTADNPSVLDNASYANYSPMVELFWHETDNFTSDYWTSTYIIPWLNYLNNNGYTFAFAENALNL